MFLKFSRGEGNDRTAVPPHRNENSSVDTAAP